MNKLHPEIVCVSGGIKSTKLKGITMVFKNPFQNYKIERILSYKMVFERDSRDYSEESYTQLLPSHQNSCLKTRTIYCHFLRL